MYRTAVSSLTEHVLLFKWVRISTELRFLVDSICFPIQLNMDFYQVRGIMVSYLTEHVFLFNWVRISTELRFIIWLNTFSYSNEYEFLPNWGFLCSYTTEYDFLSGSGRTCSSCWCTVRWCWCSARPIHWTRLSIPYSMSYSTEYGFLFPNPFPDQLNTGFYQLRGVPALPAGVPNNDFLVDWICFPIQVNRKTHFPIQLNTDFHQVRGVPTLPAGVLCGGADAARPLPFSYPNEYGFLSVYGFLSQPNTDFYLFVFPYSVGYGFLCFPVRLNTGFYQVRGVSTLPTGVLCGGADAVHSAFSWIEKHIHPIKSVLDWIGKHIQLNRKTCSRWLTKHVFLFNWIGSGRTYSSCWCKVRWCWCSAPPIHWLRIYVSLSISYSTEYGFLFPILSPIQVNTDFFFTFHSLFNWIRISIRFGAYLLFLLVYCAVVLMQRAPFQSLMLSASLRHTPHL